MDFDYRILAKFLTKELAPDEWKQLILWRDQSEENKSIFSELVRLRLQWKFQHYNSSDRIEQALQKIQLKMGEKKQFFLFRPLIKYVAIFFLLISMSYAGWHYYLQPEEYLTFVVKEGEHVKKMILADGTTVWLKEGSTLRIPGSFTEKERKLTLQGEAFFDVTPNPQSPFYVGTDYMSIKVLGTSFNVKTDASQKHVETILSKGKVALLDPEGKMVTEMLPGEKITYNHEKKEFLTEMVDTNIETAWRLNQFVFDNITLREIVNQLSAKFDVNINLESSSLAQRKFRCVINENESLPDILKLLGYMAPIHYKIEDKEIFIYE